MATKEERSELYIEPQMSARWDLAVVVTTVVSLALAILDALFDLGRLVSGVIFWADNVACLFFFVDFVRRLRRARRRREFVRRNWVDVLGAVPMVDAFRSVRLIRLVRLVRLTRLAPHWQTWLRRYEVSMPTGAVTSIGVFTILMWVLSASAFYRFEKAANGNIDEFSDALWWSMTTLSTVGYGDIYPSTDGGRVVAIATMVLGIGLLGAVAATVASALVDFRDRGRRGERRYSMHDHLLVLGWNDKSKVAIQNFLLDPRYRATDVVIVATLELCPVDDPRVRFVRGLPGNIASLRRACAESAGAAIVFSADPADPRSDHEGALIATALRRLNPTVRVGAELVDSDNHEHMTFAGCDAVIDKGTTIANLLVRSVQDIGISDVMTELLTAEVGSELYRIPVESAFVGKAFREYAIHMLDASCSVIGLARGHTNLLNPAPDCIIEPADHAFVVAKDPPA